VQRPLQRDRRVGLPVVVKRLSECDAQEEEQQGETDPDPPPDQLLPSASAAALLTLDRREGRHGL
jgi:hypothetical protein